MESKADKMFSELGYEKFENSEKITFEKEFNDDFETVVCIFFDEKKKHICVTEEDIFATNIRSVGMDELKAINEKVKELGWL